MDPILSTLFGLLASNLWVGILAILIYFIVQAAPKVLEAFEKYLATKNEELEKIGSAIKGHESALDRIIEAIHSFEKAMVVSVSDLKSHIDKGNADIKTEIRDQKIRELADLKLRDGTNSPPSIKGN